MQRYRFIVRTVQAVEIDGENVDAAREALLHQLPLNAEILTFIDCETDNLRQLNSNEIDNLVQSGKLTFDQISDIINTENEEKETQNRTDANSETN